MCGIFGISRQDSTLQSDQWWSEHLGRVNQIQKHRGPDEQKFWFDTASQVGLAHQRLAILDLSEAGRQPMVSADKKNRLVFNGEIYNFEELKKKLPLIEYKGHSDTEVLLQALQTMHTKALDQLDGMFAFGYYQTEQNKILLAKDSAGKKPLYVYWDGNTFAFASEIKAFRAFHDLDLSWDKTQLQDYLIHGYVSSPKTLYRYVTRLPAGHFQIFDLGQRQLRPPQKYWDLPAYCSETKRQSATAYQEELHSLLANAIRKRLRADVPVGCFLSGGLDSSIVALEASKLLGPAKLRTFSAAFFEKGQRSSYDESVFAQKVVEQIQSEHIELPIDLSECDVSSILSHFDEPFADSSALPTYLLSKKTACHVKVCLSGDGGDELFGGYLRFRAGLLSEEWAWLLRPLMTPFAWQNPDPRSWCGLMKRFHNRLKMTTIVQQQAWNSYFDEYDFKKILSHQYENLYQKATQFEQETKDLSVGQKILHYNFKTYLHDDLLVKVDRMSMARGLEVRSPFLDKELIEFAFRLPSRFKFTTRRTKIILKDLYEREFGKSFVNRKKQGFAIPIQDFYENQRDKLNLVYIKNQFPFLKINEDHLALWAHQKNYSKFYALLALQLCGSSSN